MPSQLISLPKWCHLRLHSQHYPCHLVSHLCYALLIVSACVPMSPTLSGWHYPMVQANHAGKANHSAVLVGVSYMRDTKLYEWFIDPSQNCTPVFCALTYLLICCEKKPNSIRFFNYFYSTCIFITYITNSELFKNNSSILQLSPVCISWYIILYMA